MQEILEAFRAWANSWALWPPTAPTWADWIGIAIAIFGGGAAYFQYRKNSRESSAVRAADEMELFQNDELVTVALRMLDWKECRIPYRLKSGEAAVVNEQDFHLALRHHSVPRSSSSENYLRERDPFAVRKATKGEDFEERFSGPEHYIRDAFDRLLGRLERVESLIKKRVISEDDFEAHFSYWIELIGDKGEHRKISNFTTEKQITLHNYISMYKFSKVIDLFRRYGKDISASSPDQDLG